MTNEEAIKELSEWLDACCGGEEIEPTREALRVAIEALKAQDVAGDTIYRQDAIDALYKMLHDYFWADDEELDAAIATLNDLPSAQPEVIRCKDCRHGVDYYHEGDCYCSNPKWGLTYFGGSWEFYCADAERRTDEND